MGAISGFWLAICIIVVVSVVADAVVKITRNSRSGASKQLSERVDELESDLAAIAQDLVDARERIVVLEKIVTDDKANLSRQIDDLVSGQDG